MTQKCQKVTKVAKKGQKRALFWGFCEDKAKGVFRLFRLRKNLKKTVKNRKNPKKPTSPVRPPLKIHVFSSSKTVKKKHEKRPFFLLQF